MPDMTSITLGRRRTSLKTIVDQGTRNAPKDASLLDLLKTLVDRLLNPKSRLQHKR
jgi:hypothetical protein